MSLLPLSYSRLRTYTCPHRYYQKYVNGVDEESSPEARIGSAAHAVVADYRRHLHATDTASDPTLWDRCCGLQLARCSEMDPEIYDDLKGLLWNIDPEWLVIDPAVDDWEIERGAAVDAELKPVDFSDPSAVFRWIPDYVTVKGGIATIVDYKTGYSQPDPMQLTIYCACEQLLPWAEANGVEQWVLQYLDLRSGTITTVDQNADTWMAPQEVYDLILTTASQIASRQEWPAMPGSWCQYCRVPCQLKAELAVACKNTDVLRAEAIVTADQAQRAIRFVLTAEALLSSVKDRLREYVEIHGPVQLEDIVAEIRPNTPWKVKDTEGLAKELVANGVPRADVWRSLSISEASLDSLLRRHLIAGEAERLKDSYGERKQYKGRFGLYKAEKY